jgi:hypothetical protein
MAGDTGFEPVNDDFKDRCLGPTWLIPNRNKQDAFFSFFDNKK